VCDDPIACRAIDEELVKGLTYAALSRLMGLRGFKVGADTLSQHDKHRRPAAPAGIAKTKKDLATLVRDQVHDGVEKGEIDLLDRHGQGAIKVGLSAEKLIDGREARTKDTKAVIQLAVLLAGGPAGLLPPPDLLEDGNTLEGEYVPVDES